MPGIILNPIANYGAGKGLQPEPPYVPTYEGVYFAGRDQYYYSGSNLYNDPNRLGGMNRTLFSNSGSSDGWVTTINSAGAANTPIKVVAAGSLREYTIQSWYIDSGSPAIQYKSLLTSNKDSVSPAIVYQTEFPDTSGDILGIETSLDEEYAIAYGTEFLRTSTTDTHESGMVKLPYSNITSSYAGDSTFKTNIGSGPHNSTRSAAPGTIHGVHINKDKKIGVCHNGVGWDNVTGSVQEFVVLNNDGSRDTNFNFSGSWTNQFGDEQINGSTYATYYFDNPSDGKKRWIVAGLFKKFNGTTYNHILAFDETGSLESSFNTGIGTGFNSIVRNIFKIDDDFMCVVGDFTTYNGSTVYGAAIIRYDGALLNGITNHDGVRVWDGVYDGTYMYLRGDFKNWTPSGGTPTFVNGIISCQTNFQTLNPNYDIGTGSLVTDTGYSDIFTSGSSEQVEVFLG